MEEAASITVTDSEEMTAGNSVQTRLGGFFVPAIKKGSGETSSQFSSTYKVITMRTEVFPFTRSHMERMGATSTSCTRRGSSWNKKLKNIPKDVVASPSLEVKTQLDRVLYHLVYVFHKRLYQIF